MKKGILLINLGTTAAPDASAVRRYLAEFLSDPMVIDVPWLLRMLIVYGFVLPFRPKKTAEAYEKIWTQQGSPLLVHSKQFAEKLQAALGASFKVALGMRYGQPSIQSAVMQLKNSACQTITALPLFPQYSAAATGSALKKLTEVYSDFQEIRYFYHQNAYQAVLANLIEHYWKSESPEFLLFSYHGLPERQLTKSGCDPDCCDRVQNCLRQAPNLADCYRAQCFATTEAVVKKMQLTETQYQTAFQSRLGRAKWIQPYTDAVLTHLRQRGVTRLMVACPSFVADCLETLEEIGIRLKAQWLAMGGEKFSLVPSLNADPVWVNAAADMIKEVVDEH